MKFNELINENSKVNEAPMGLLKTAGHSMMKAVSPTSAGKLETGTAANQLYSEFKKYLGQTGEQAEADVVLKFLQSKGLPTQGAEAIIQAAGDEQPGALKTAAKAAAGDAVDAAAGAMKKIGGAVKNVAAKGMDRLKGAVAGQQSQPTDKQEPNLDEPTAQQDQQSRQQTKQPTATYSMSTGFDPVTMKNKSEPMSPGIVGAVPNPSSDASRVASTLRTASNPGNSPQPTPTGRKQGGGKIAGQLSQSPSAIQKRQKRAGGKTSSALGQFVSTQMGKNPIKMKAGESIEYHYNKLIESLDYEYLPEALSKSVLDKVFLAAVQDAAKAGGGSAQGGSQQGSSGGASGGGSAGSDQQSGGGFLSGFKQGFQGGGAGGDGKVQGNINVGQLAQLLQVDQRELATALAKLKQGQGLSRSHVNTLSNAFISLYKADPQTTVRIANMLKRVSVDAE